MVGRRTRAGFGVLDDTGQAVVIGQGECLQTQLDGGGDKVLRLVGAIEEGIGGNEREARRSDEQSRQARSSRHASHVEHMYTLQVCSTPAPSPIPTLLALR